VTIYPLFIIIKSKVVLKKVQEVSERKRTDHGKKLLDLISAEVTKAFEENGYDGKYGKVTLSNRPDLCEYQCNGAMAAAKEYKCAPFMISDKICGIFKG